jgi:hypothetical protein
LQATVGGGVAAAKKQWRLPPAPEPQSLGARDMRKLGILLIACAYASITTWAVQAAPLTPEGVSVQIEKLGTRAALTRIYNTKGEWQELLKGIGSGTVAWLRVAARLRPASDAGTSEQLDLAVGEALEHQPRNVLTVAMPAFTISVVCGGPNVDDARYDSYELSIKAIELRKAKLREISDPDLAKLRDDCIKNLESSKAGIASFYDVHH